MKVVKRDGRIEDLDISKIKKYTKASTDGIDGVSLSELEVDAKIQFRDGITTEEIQHTLIKTAYEKIDIDRPNWTFVAARLFLYDLYHRVSKTESYGDFEEYVDKCISLGRMHPKIKEGYDLKKMGEYLDLSRDLQFTYLGIKTMYDRYLIKDQDGKPIELPQQMFMTIAMFLALNEKEDQREYWAKRFYDVLSKFELMVATPTLSNARTLRHQLSSCFVGSTPDNIEGIFDTYSEKALLSKYGGGVGWDWSKVRAMGGFIAGHKNAAGGIIPFLKVSNDVAVAVDQLGVRKGAFAPYVENWHMDVLDFIDLRKNSGEERRRAHELFPALWISDLFMERVKNNADWTLFDPYDVSDLTDCYGDEFKTKYEEYEKRTDINKNVISAKELWKKTLMSYFETGMPFLGFKDEANRRNQNSHDGLIRSSNLCTEIFLNTEPNKYLVKVFYENPDYLLKDDKQPSYVTFEENEELTIVDQIPKESTLHTKRSYIKKAKNLSPLDIIYKDDEYYEVYAVEKEMIRGETAVCNLASINLAKIYTQEDMQRVTEVAVRILDNVIDLNYYPNYKTKKTSQSTRAIGLGVMGEAQLLALKNIMFGSPYHYEFIDEVMENYSYYTILASVNLAKERGAYPTFKGSNWSKGIIPIDTANQKAKELTNRTYLRDWDGLREKVKEGIRNGYLMAVAPTSSISILVGTTQTIEPVYKKKWFEQNLSGMIPNVVPNLNLDTFNYYVSAYDLDQIKLVEAGAVRQKWIDQGQSLNIFVKLETSSGKKLNDIYMRGWELGLKSTYYLRSESPDSNKVNDNIPLDRSIECEGCQ